MNKDDSFVKNEVRYIFKGKSIEVEKLRRIHRSPLKDVPPRGGNIISFFKDAVEAYEECYRETEAYGTPLPAELIAKVYGIKKLVDYPREHPHFYDWMSKTYEQRLDEYFVDEDLKKLLSGSLGYIGASPGKTPTSSALTACVSYYIHVRILP